MNADYTFIFDYFNMNQIQHKIFNIGFHKTGTTSLTQFMQILGYKSLHSVAMSMELLQLGRQDECGIDTGMPCDFKQLIDDDTLNNTVKSYDFFSDNPWPLLYRHLDKSYPNSKFILTLRNNDKWINSLVKHSGDGNARMRQLIYGYGNPSNHIVQYRKTYIRHNKKVQEYFKDKNNLLVIDIAEDDKVLANKILAFLELEHRDLVFPTMNKRQS